MAEGQLSFANNSRHHSSSASLGSNCKYCNVRVHVCSLPSIVSRIASAIGQTSNKNASGTLTRLQRGSYTSCVLYPWAPRIAYWRWVLNKQHFNSSSIQMTHRFGKGWCICIHVCSSRPPELWGMVRIDTSIICISTVPKYSIDLLTPSLLVCIRAYDGAYELWFSTQSPTSCRPGNTGYRDSTHCTVPWVMIQRVVEPISEMFWVAVSILSNRLFESLTSRQLLLTSQSIFIFSVNL